MTPDVVVDIGNSRIKWGRCEGGRVAEMVSLAGDDPAGWEQQLGRWRLSGPVRWATASVHPARRDAFTAWVTARGDTLRTITHSDIRLQIDVEEPTRVGIDRLLNAVAGRATFADEPLAPGTHVVVIDIGSAMTIDLLWQNHVFSGGAILPGPWMMARALHEFTAKLPLIDPRTAEPAPAFGRNTTQAMQSGIQEAILGAAVAFIRDLRGHSADARPAVIATGGGHDFLRRLPHFVEVEALAVVPELTLEGIRIAAEVLP